MTQSDNSTGGLSVSNWLKGNISRIIGLGLVGILLFAYSRGCFGETTGAEANPREAVAAIVKPVDVAVRIDTLCLDGEQLNVSLGFDQPVTENVFIQILTRGQPYFHSESGLHDAYQTNQTVEGPIDHIDLAVSVESMPIGQSITLFIDLITFDGHFEYQKTISAEVISCFPSEAVLPTITSTPVATSTPNPDGVPAILNDQCVSKTQLMIVFEFENSVQGQYELFVNNVSYEITPVSGRPERLFFFGAAPPGGGKPTIRLQSLPDHSLVLETTDYSVKQCDFQAPNNANPGGSGDYVPPP